MCGLRFTEQDWEKALDSGEASYLLHVKSENEGGLPEGLRKYLEVGVQMGVSKAYKCRTRSPWFRVPHVYRPDAFLTYMSGVAPRLVANDAEAVAPNTLHVVRMHGLTGVCSDALAVLWQTSLTRLSAEIEGHALGGGMLKLEPSEAESVLVAMPPVKPKDLTGLGEELDKLVRQGKAGQASSLADGMILRHIGLSRADYNLLADAAEQLRCRRYARGAAP